MGSIGSLETSVSNHLTPRNTPEDGRIHFVFLRGFVLKGHDTNRIYGYEAGNTHKVIEIRIN
jgi:hypothetical protein